MPAAQLLGQVLSQARDEEGVGATTAIDGRLNKLLSDLELSTQDGVRRFCELLDHLSEDYPQVLLLRSAGGGGPSFGKRAFDFFRDLKVFGEARVRIINCLTRYLHAEAAAPADPMDATAGDAPAPKQPPLELGAGPGQVALRKVLEQQETQTQLAAMRLASALRATRGAAAVLPLLGAMDGALGAHRSAEVRKLYYELLIALHKQDAQLDESSRPLVRAALLRVRPAFLFHLDPSRPSAVDQILLDMCAGAR